MTGLAILGASLLVLLFIYYAGRMWAAGCARSWMEFTRFLKRNGIKQEEGKDVSKKSSSTGNVD